MFDLAETAMDAAIASGAGYADARVMASSTERWDASNGEIEKVKRFETYGIGVRALVGSSWGFASTNDPAQAHAVGAKATAIARASARVAGDPLPMAETDPVEAEYFAPVIEDPRLVSDAEKGDLLTSATEIAGAVKGVRQARGMMAFWDIDKWFVSSEGHRIHQHLVESGAGMGAVAVGDGETQIRSYPQSFGQFETGGFEIVRRWDLLGHAQRIGDEAVALLGAVPCPQGQTDVILEGSQLALQIHESVGHAIELDRILGWEAAFAGTSFLSLDQLGSLKYGSGLMNITADATLPGALGTFGYDDEGTPAQRVEIVDHGIWVGVLSGRDTASLAGLPPGGMVRASEYNRMPMVRMTNVGLLPGTGSLEEIISDTDDGIYMETNRSWSIDDKRLNFQFGCEVGWEIKHGRRGRMLRNPTYTGITPEFWGSLDRLAGEEEWVHWGTPNCGKGQPIQVAHTGHSASPGRFRNVRVGVRG